MNETYKNKIAPILNYVGAIGASITAIMYIIIVIIMIVGMKARNITSVVEFAVVNAIVGLVIAQFLKIQGESFARNSEENKAVVEKYYNTKTKDKKIHSMNYFWVTSLIKDIGTKVLGVTLTSIGITIIAIQGMHDYTYLMLALANLFMFISLGLLGMNKAYNYFNNMHVPYMKEKIKEAEEQNGNNL